MKIALLCHYFWPEPGAPSARLLGLGRNWVAQGHEVTVVTNFPNHPTGLVPERYRGRSFAIEEVEGIRVLRCRTYATPNRALVRRTLGHLFFMAQSLGQATQHLRGTNVIIASSPTLFAVVSAWAMSRRLDVPFVFEVRDLWPGIFAELGIIRSRAILRALESLELFLYRRAAAVVTVTSAFAEDISRRGIPAEKIHVIRNGVALDGFVPGPPDADLRARLGVQGRFVVLYAGAHGISQRLQSILESAALLRDDPRIHFLFVGEGAERDQLVSAAQNRGLSNVTFREPVSREEMPALYRSADVCLVPLRNIPLFRGFIPSKMFEILACGRPIVASVEGEAAEILNDSGAAIVVKPEDARAIADALLRLADDEGLATSLGARGRPFVQAHYDHKALAMRYAAILGSLRSDPAGPGPRTLGAAGAAHGHLRHRG